MMQRGGRGRGGGLGSIVHGAVSVAAEYRAHRKETKAASNRDSRRAEDASFPSDPPAYNEANDGPIARGTPPASEMYSNQNSNGASGPLEDDEAMWALDEVATLTYDEGEAEYTSTNELVNDVVRLNHRSTATEVHQPLSFPVIIPQRRPRNKSRGFVRAYAPVLAESGIDQATFLQFLKNFHKSSQASPIFPIIQISAGIASFAPSLIATAVCMSVQVLATVGAEMQSRQRTNTFLDRINDELFKPRGLYAMIIKYKPKPDGNGFVQAQAVDTSTNKIIAKYAPSSNDERNWSDRMRTLRASSGTTKGADALPEAAPLIFPAIDRAIAADGGEETLKDRTRDAKKFLNAYMDRRAQMKFAASDPHSTLNLPEDQKQMRSKWSNPDHPMFSGNLVDLVTGGALSSAGRPSAGTSRGSNQGVGGAFGRGGGRGGFGGNSGGGSGGPSIKKLMQEDVLYLLIVNMPSEAELAEARRVMDQSQ